VPLIRRLAAAALLAASGAIAAAPAEAPVLKVSRSVIVHAAPDAAWRTVGDFGRVHAWHPGVAKTEIVEGADDRPGAVRLLTLRGGGTLRERLLDYDARHHRYRYALVDGAWPVSGYTAVIGVKAAGRNRSKVTWSATFRRKDTGPHPAADADDAAAKKAVGETYQAGLERLKAVVDSGRDGAAR